LRARRTMSVWWRSPSSPITRATRTGKGQPCTRSTPPCATCQVERRRGMFGDLPLALTPLEGIHTEAAERSRRSWPPSKPEKPCTEGQKAPHTPTFPVNMAVDQQMQKHKCTSATAGSNSALSTHSTVKLTCMRCNTELPLCGYRMQQCISIQDSRSPTGDAQPPPSRLQESMPGGQRSLR